MANKEGKKEKKGETKYGKSKWTVFCAITFSQICPEKSCLRELGVTVLPVLNFSFVVGKDSCVHACAVLGILLPAQHKHFST